MVNSVRYFVNHSTRESTWNRPCPVLIQHQPPPYLQPSISIPAGWIQRYDITSQRPYYFNSFTQQASWDLPAADAVVEPALECLPDGWKQGIDPSGKVYFINDSLRLVQVVTVLGSYLQAANVTHCCRTRDRVLQHG